MIGNNNGSRFIKVGFVKYPPAVFNTCSHFPEFAITSKCPFPGHCIEILRIIALQLNLSIQPVVLSQSKSVVDVGSMTNDDKWNGILGAIANGTVDTGCLFYQKTPPRVREFDFSVPLYSTLSRIAVRDQNSYPFADMWRLFMPFTLDTWLTLVFSILLHMATFMLIGRLEKHWAKLSAEKEQLFRQPFNIFWRLLRLQMLQPRMITFKSLSGKFLVFVFSFVQCVLFTSLYRSWIVTSLVQPKPANPISDATSFVKDVQQGKYTFVSQYKGHWFYESLNNSMIFPFKEMREGVAHKPTVQARNIQDSLQLIEQRGNVMFLQSDDPAYFYSARICNIVFVDKEMPYRTSHFLFRKGSPFTEHFNRVIELERVAIKRAYDRYRTLREMIWNQECEEKLQKSRLYKPLSFEPMVGLLIVFGIFIGIALATFGIECAIGNKRLQED